MTKALIPLSLDTADRSEGLKEETSPEKPCTTAAVGTAAGSGLSAAGAAGETAEEVDRKEQPDKTMTMSEWRALHGRDNAVISSTSAARPANNGEDVFCGMNVYKKRAAHANDSDSEVVIAEDEIDSKGRRHIKVNVEFSGRNRRGRGNFGSSGGGNRFGREEKKGAAVTADGGVLNWDEDEFPTLS